jgi:MPBQ/MSBQ methyltransferase
MSDGLLEFAERYAAAIFDPRARSLYDGSDFFNVGDWSDGPSGPPAGLGEAARRLVERHLSADAGAEAREASLVLDIGCGLGAGTAMMVRHYRNAVVLGLNISLAQAVHGARHAPDGRFVVMDGARLGIASDSVNRVHCIEAAFHFDSRDDFFAEVGRVLRPGGKAFVSDILFRKGFGSAIPARNIWTGEAEYRSCCARAGLVVEALCDITACTLRPFHAHIAKSGRRSDAVLQRRAQEAYYFVTLKKPDRQ